MKKLLIFSGYLVAFCTFSALTQVSGPDIVLVRVLESHRHAHLVIEHPGQAVEEIDFDWSDDRSKNQSAAKGYYGALAKFFAYGYQVTTIPGTEYTSGFVHSTLIFTRPTATPGR
jgi:hypothetical protein